MPANAASETAIVAAVPLPLHVHDPVGNIVAVVDHPRVPRDIRVQFLLQPLADIIPPPSHRKPTVNFGLPHMLCYLPIVVTLYIVYPPGVSKKRSEKSEKLSPGSQLSKEPLARKNV